MQRPPAARRFAIDAVVSWYFALMAGLTVAFRESLPRFPALLSLYLAALALSLALPWATRSWARHRQAQLRAGLCVLLIPLAFLSLAYLLPAISPDDRSWQLLQWDRRLFGGDPLREASWLRAPVLAEFFAVAYASYYFLPIALGIALSRRGDWKALERSTFAVGLGFLLSYLCYFVYPARSPYLLLPDLVPQGSAILDAMHAFVVHAGLFKSEAFPSGHTGLTLVTLALAWKHHRAAFWALLPLGLGILGGTIALGYHYLVDLVAGALFGVGVLILLRICGGAEDQEAEKA